MKKVTYYEIKKIFTKASSKIAVLILFAVVGFACFSAIHEVKWVDSQGEEHTGIQAVKNMKEEKEKWAGPLTEERLQEIIKEVRKVNLLQKSNSDNVQEENIAYSKVQGIEDIRMLAAGAYGGMQEFNYFAIDSLSPDDAKDFYPNRAKVIKEWLDQESSQFSEDEKEFLLQQYKEPEGPWDYQYADGWLKLFDYSVMPMIAIMLILGFLVSGIFPGESRLKADSVYFSAYHGRGKATLAKIKAGFLVVTVCYWVVILVYSGIVLGIMGAGGANCVIQTELTGWKSYYHLTYGQEYLLILFGGYLGSLFISFFSMLISAKTDSAVIAVTIPFLLIFFPSFFRGNTFAFMEKIIGIMPDQFIQLNRALDDFNLYHIGGKITGAIPVIFGLYLILTLIIVPLCYFIYRKKAVL